MHEKWEYKLLNGHGRKRIMKSEDGVEHGSFNQELLNSLGNRLDRLVIEKQR